MGQERNIIRHKIINPNDAGETRYWMKRLGITKLEVRRLAETMNKPVPGPSLVVPKTPTPSK